MSTTTIHHNGSKWAGQVVDTIDELVIVLGKHELIPTLFPFAHNLKGEKRGSVEFFGNFETISHAFLIETDDPEVCQKLMRAIQANRTYKKLAAAEKNGIIL